MGLRTINERINQLEARLAHVHREPISEVPAVVQFDGIWLSMQTQQDSLYEDRRKRKRHRTRGKRMVVLIALGLEMAGVAALPFAQTAHPGLGSSRARRPGCLGTTGATLVGARGEARNGAAGHCA